MIADDAHLLKTYSVDDFYNGLSVVIHKVFSGRYVGVLESRHVYYVATEMLGKLIDHFSPRPSTIAHSMKEDERLSTADSV